MARIPFAKCEHCGEYIFEGSTPVYNEDTEEYFCDHWCFEDWVDEHTEELLQKYVSLYVGKVQV